MRNLELVETLREKEKDGSLLWMLDRTKTAMGARMLRSWVDQPLIPEGIDGPARRRGGRSRDKVISGMSCGSISARSTTWSV